MTNSTGEHYGGMSGTSAMDKSAKNKWNADEVKFPAWTCAQGRRGTERSIKCLICLLFGHVRALHSRKQHTEKHY